MSERVNLPDELLAAWDELRAAIDRSLTALPHQVSAASMLLEEQRASFDEMIRRDGRPKRQKTPTEAGAK